MGRIRSRRDWPSLVQWGSGAVIAVLTLVFARPAPAAAESAAASSAPGRDSFGVVLVGQVATGITGQQRLDRVGARWYYDYSDRLDDEPQGYHKVGMVRCGEQNQADLVEIGAQAHSRPGRAWLVCNEPDLLGQDAVSDTFLQARSETRPQFYARLVHRYATALHAADPTAQLVGPNLFNAGGLGIAWLTALRAAYTAEFGQDLPFDVLGIHLYAFDPGWKHLPQIDLGQNERFLAASLGFAAELQRHPHVWVTEVGSMWIYDEITCAPTGSDGKCRGNTVTWPTLTAFTENVVRSMSAAGVERWFFFSTNPAPDPWASVPNATYLANERNELTPIGVAWLQATAVAVDAKWASRLTHTETSAGSAPAANPVLETGL